MPEASVRLRRFAVSWRYWVIRHLRDHFEAQEKRLRWRFLELYRDRDERA